MKRGAEDDREADRKRLRTPVDGKLDGIPLEAQTEPVQYHCDSCSKDISNTVKMRCAVCAEHELCLECFAAGSELKGHKREHAYRVIDNMHFPFFEINWSADEEMLLLEGLESYGIGNWRDIAEHVSTKDQQQCQTHYNEFYMGSPEWPNISFEYNCIATRERVMLLNSGKYNKLGLKREPITKAKPTPKSMGRPNKAEQTKNPIDSDLNGYMPLRGEFETEWDNGAETKIKDIVFDEDDSPEQEEIKLQLLECYYHRVSTRKKRDSYVVEKRLHDIKYLDQLTKARSKEANDLNERGIYKKYLQILSPEEYEEFLRDLAKQQQLEHQVLKLQAYRRRGIATMLEANQYEEELRRRESERNRSKYKKQKTTQPVNLEGQPGFNLLSKAEQELCQNFYILPHQFLLVKEAFISEYVKGCDLAKNTAIQLTEMGTFVILGYLLTAAEVDKAGKIFEFMQEVGWINNRGHLAVPALPRSTPQIEKEEKKQEEEQPKEEQQKPQPLASFLKKPATDAATTTAVPLKFGAGKRTANLFKWPRT